jgi:hypothetical protein
MNLQAIAPLIEDIIKDTLEQKIYPFGMKYTGVGNKVATGRLKNSVKASVTSLNNENVINVEMEDYWKDVQNGVKPGTIVSIEDLLTWIKARRLRGRDNKGRYTSMTLETLAYLIRKKIKRFGVPVQDDKFFVDIALEKIMNDEQIADLLEQATVDELMNLIVIK